MATTVGASSPIETFKYYFLMGIITQRNPTRRQAAMDHCRLVLAHNLSIASINLNFPTSSQRVP